MLFGCAVVWVNFPRGFCCCRGWPITLGRCSEVEITDPVMLRKLVLQTTVKLSGILSRENMEGTWRELASKRIFISQPLNVSKMVPEFPRGR